VTFNRSLTGTRERSHCAEQVDPLKPFERSFQQLLAKVKTTTYFEAIGVLYKPLTSETTVNCSWIVIAFD
jgi:hypothetical protein